MLVNDGVGDPTFFGIVALKEGGADSLLCATCHTGIEHIQGSSKGLNGEQATAVSLTSGRNSLHIHLQKDDLAVCHARGYKKDRLDGKEHVAAVEEFCFPAKDKWHHKLIQS